MAVRRKHIRILVEQILESQGVESAPVDVGKLASVLGVTVRYEATEDNLSGFLLKGLKQHKAVIGVNSNHSTNRQRFTVAHELGHFFLHEGERVHVDHAFQVKLRNENSSKGISVEEKEANLFAAELLIPEIFIRQDLAEIDTLDLFDDEELTNLARRYQVSTQALTFRLAYLNYIQL